MTISNLALATADDHINNQQLTSTSYLAKALESLESGTYNDKVQSNILLTKLSQEGNTLAMFLLSGQYETGNGTNIDIQKSNELLLKAATLGSPLAQYELGKKLIKGDHIEQNLSTGMCW
ncbi:tetratricopeptide repeat protein [Psychrobacter sp. I-STPA6b]|uniref:tetratricopeptide repeat protein n=1 Tax=Psychrobacter sp. I-STPA6b TaxID=2585718 RepID=UPI001D0C29D2|nr:hypothetical protein [Psychrobacter sp. I-STPA6b]